MKLSHLTSALFLSGITLLIGINLPANTIAQSAEDIKLKPANKYFKMPANVTEKDYKAKTVVIKIRDEYRTYCNDEQVSIASLQSFLNKIGCTGIQKVFPHAKKPLREENKYGYKYADITLVFQLEYAANLPLEKVINGLTALGISEYVEPYYIYHTTYTPNDPQASSQYHLTNIKAYQAWDISKGDTNIVIGIVDSGMDIDHPDLVNNIKYNYADPINSVDDDGDGYIDNFRGWDLFDDDNNPQSAGSDHGVHVSGCASASTDNGIGVAGPGFNCTILPIKAGDGGTIDFGYPGITYAADHGASVINCSWGGPGGGNLGQDVIDYATINNDALVVAAAGNDGTEDLFYPASYNYVLNVAWLNQSDVINGSSNYGYAIDVCAPGSSILSTGNGGIYYQSSGTSMASPIVAGAAALVRANYSFLDALQAGEQLKVTADNIYPVNNTFYADKLGTGRINLYNALNSGITGPSIVMTERNVSDGNDEAFVIGDTLTIDGIYVNYLAPSGSVTVTLTANSTNVNILDGTTSLGSLGAFGGTANNTADPFLIKILPGAQLNEKVIFELLLSDGSYSTTVFFYVLINVDYINITINDLATTITSKSLIGFNDFSTQLEGLGFVYPYTNNGDNLLFDGGLMVGVPGKVSDHVRADGGNVDQDFTSVSNVQRLPVPVVSEFDMEGIFDDSNSPSPLGIEVEHKAFAWSKSGHRKYVIVEYKITNNSGATLDNMYAGIFCDWDIAMGDPTGYLDNLAATDMNRSLGYAYNTNIAGLYAGVQVLTNGGFIHYGIDNDGSNGSVDIYNGGYPSTDKYTTLSTMRSTAGERDVSNVVSTGPMNLADGDSILIAFALIAGDDLADLQESADSAYIQYNGFPIPVGIKDNKPNVDVQLEPNYPNPGSDYTSMGFYIPERANVKLEVFNLIGQKLIQVMEGSLDEGSHKYNADISLLSDGVYFYKLTVDGEEFTRKMTVVK